MVLTSTAMFRASADQMATAARPEKSYTGMIVSVDPKENTLEIKGFMLSRQFNLGSACNYILLDKSPATVNDLRPGQKVTVSYQDAQSVLIADRVEQEPVQFEGVATVIDTGKHTLIVHRTGLDKELQLPDDCKVVLHNEKPGTFADIHSGSHVTVTYETPDGTPTAREIAQTSIEFTGMLTAIDLGEKTVKAQAMFESKKFKVADNCTIVINGKTDGQLSDLKPDDKLVFTFDEINGINVVNRIAPAEAQANSATTTAQMTGN